MDTKVTLFIDQDSGTYQHLGSRIEDESTVFMRVSSSAEALKMLQNEPVALVVLDAETCSMPIQDIVPIIRGINKDLPIIVTCLHNSPDLEKQVRQQNIFYYHIKSFGISDLELAVRNALEKHRAKRA